MFSTIIMYSDQKELTKSIELDKIEGIAVIDEIDLHLHIELQNEVLPKLIKLFPKIQFIITTHSPFFLSGISKIFSSDDYVMISLPDGFRVSDVYSFEEFQKAYELFNKFSVNYKEEYEKLKSKIAEENDNILIITEGKTDWKHLKAAFNNLNSDYKDLSISFFEFENDFHMGKDTLDTMINRLGKVFRNKKIIGVFDRDDKNILKKYGVHDFVNVDNNVYAMCIPKIDDDLDKISIEYYYRDEDLFKKDENNRRLFDGKCFSKVTGISNDKIFMTKEHNKVGEQKIIDKSVYKIDDSDEKSVALSKNEFAQHILNKDKNFENINFENFRRIFDVFEKIRLNMDNMLS